MKNDQRIIVAMGGHHPDLDHWVVSLAGRRAPRVCYVPTASGDDWQTSFTFHTFFLGMGCQASVLNLFNREVEDLERFLLSQDIIYVGGGNTANMLAIWRLHGVDKILRQAWERGIILAGYSAGSLCWFKGGTTDSFGPLRELNDGLGFLNGSHCPHYDVEPKRRVVYPKLIRQGKLPSGIAADDDVALIYKGTTFSGAVAAEGGSAWKVGLGDSGIMVEEKVRAQRIARSAR